MFRTAECMSQSHPDPPTETTPQGPHTLISDQELAAQARAAADQALQLAKLAEESARLARHLNEQVAIRADRSVAGTPAADHIGSTGAADPEHPVFPDDATNDGRPLLANTEERWVTLTRRRRRSRQNRAAPRSLADVSPTISETIPASSSGIGSIEQYGKHRAGSLRSSVHNWKSVTLSTAFHVAVLLMLGLLTLAIRPQPRIDTIMASFIEDDAPEQVEIEQPLAVEELQAFEELPANDPPPEVEPIAEVPAVPENLAEPEPDPPPPDELLQKPANENRVDEREMRAQAEQAANVAVKQDVDLKEVGSRSEVGKQILLKKYGGTAASEAALSRALAWLAGIQRRDGSWNFNDVGGASHAGTVNNPMGATSYVLLTFLGAGQTHQVGTHKANVARGINFLIKHARPVPAGVDLRGPNVEENHNFYVQGAAAMALCEAFEMTKDRRLRIPAQRAIDFVAAAQDPHGGGWRYEPFEPGCTSVTTLQLTAFVSAQRAGFKVAKPTLDGIRHFYDTVQCDGGPTGRYCYRAAEPNFKSASTAQAALGRMYLGATRHDEDLQAAVRILDERGPYDNRYYCYYATQVLKNWGGDEWQRWNAGMRDELIRTQAVEEGPAMGSWTPLQRGATDTAGGRLFTTVLSAMTLEVYYRYLPLYDSVDEDEADPAADQQMVADGKDES